MCALPLRCHPDPCRNLADNALTALPGDLPSSIIILCVADPPGPAARIRFYLFLCCSAHHSHHTPNGSKQQVTLTTPPRTLAPCVIGMPVTLCRDIARNRITALPSSLGNLTNLLKLCAGTEFLHCASLLAAIGDAIYVFLRPASFPLHRLSVVSDPIIVKNPEPAAVVHPCLCLGHRQAARNNISALPVQASEWPLDLQLLCAVNRRHRTWRELASAANYASSSSSTTIPRSSGPRSLTDQPPSSDGCTDVVCVSRRLLRDLAENPLGSVPAAVGDLARLMFLCAGGCCCWPAPYPAARVLCCLHAVSRQRVLNSYDQHRLTRPPFSSSTALRPGSSTRRPSPPSRAP